jgi:hypothetical protein
VDSADTFYVADSGNHTVRAGTATTVSSWRTAFFTPAQLNNSAISGDSADPDGDGLANLLEYAFHVSPTDPSAANLPSVVLDPAGAAAAKASGLTPLGVTSQTLAIVYAKAVGETELTFVVQQSSNLSQWSPASPVNEILSDDGVVQIVKAKVDTNAATKMFLRLQVSH